MSKSKHRTPEEISAMRRELARKQGFGGRPKGTRNRKSVMYGTTKDIPHVAIGVLSPTRDVFRTCAEHEGIPVIVFMMRLAEQLKTDPRYVHLFTGADPTH